MSECKKLIEVAMPVKEISAESVRDKSIRHGHISTLHLWWARRPLPVCRAVVFASLVPDPLDENCPQQFKDAIQELLGAENNPGDPYKPYDDIPFTTAIDPMEDNLRNRLLMFVGKFSDTFIENEKKGKNTPSKDQLSSFSLIKWNNKNNKEIINKAGKLIWVSRDSDNNTLQEFDKFYNDIKEAENDLYNTRDRHIESENIKQKEKILQKTIDGFQNRMPKVFDPFAGGGAIPLEAARLGCKTYANDLNPVAHIIEKGSLEFPQKYGKPITYSKNEFIKLYGEEELNRIQKEAPLLLTGDSITIDNRLAFDVEYYARKLLKMVEDKIGHLYPIDENGNKPIAYIWARTIKCSNPSCQYEIPLVGTKYLCNKSEKKVAFNFIENKILKNFDIKIKSGKEINFDTVGTVSKSKAICPHCKSINDTRYLKDTSKAIGLGKKMIAVVIEGEKSKDYLIPTKDDINSALINKKLLDDSILPNENMLEIPDLVSGRGWGIKKWRDLFSLRQLLVMQTLIIKLNEIKLALNLKNNYNQAIITYLAILINRVGPVLTSYGRWNVSGEKIEHPFSRQAIPFIFDFPESNPFCSSTGSMKNHIEWIIRYIKSECEYSYNTICNNASSGDINQFKEKILNSVITDPPYYDAIAYADLSDFFYIWLKRSLGDIYSENFAYPQTPKSEECTALKHHHNGKVDSAKEHFENKLVLIFKAIEKQTSGLISIMFAHQSTEAWTTLCNSILNANMNITGSWAIDTEMGSRMIAIGNAALESSVTISCRPSLKQGTGEFKNIKNAISDKIKKEVKFLYKLGFRGADLLTACFGQAVSEFGKYEKVEKADGSEVTVSELLEIAREAAYNAIVSDIDTDDITKFYIGWLNLFGFSPAPHDDVRRITQIGLNIDTGELLSNNIMIREGANESLASYNERIKLNNKLGEKVNSFMIDLIHKTIYLYSGSNRNALLQFIIQKAESSESNFWRICSSLAEVLPTGCDDHKQLIGLITNKDSLIREDLSIKQSQGTQMDLGM